MIAVNAPRATALLTGHEFLSKALGNTGRPLIVHVWDPNPSLLESFAIDDVSEACRDSGAAAVLCGIELVGAISKEQELHRGDFPGALPVVSEVALTDPAGFGELCTQAKASGASGIGLCYDAAQWEDASALEDALQRSVAAAKEMGLGAILLPEFERNGDEGMAGAGGLASRVGAAAGLATAPEKDEKMAFGCWDGSSDALQRLREEGFGGLVLKNACGGDVGWGSKTKQPSLAALQLARLIKASQSKGSTTIWAGAGSAGSGGGQATAYSGSSRQRSEVAVPAELAAQMGVPRWSEGS